MVFPMTEANALAGRREWIALVALVIPPLLVAMDITVLYFAVPSIAASLEPSSVQQLWMIDTYGFVVAGMLITMGNVGDLVGRRKLLMIGSALFGLASVLAAFSTSPEMLIAARALQGIGGATMIPSTLGLIRRIFRDPKQRRSAIAAWGMAVSMGSGLGPVISGLLLNNFWWGSIFLINAPIILVLLVTVPMLLPESRPATAAVARFDVLSSLLSLGSVLAVIWGIKEAAVNGLGIVPIVVIVAGLLVGALFVFRQKSLDHPMVDLKLFRLRGMAPALVLSPIGFFCLIGFSVFTTQYLMTVLGMRPLEAALWIMIAPVAVGFALPVATQLVQKVRSGYLIAAGFLVVTVGMIGMTQVGTERNLPFVLVSAVCISVGFAVAGTLITDIVVTVSPVERVASVAALQKTGEEFGGAFGVAIFGSIGAAVFTSHFDANLPADLAGRTPPAAHETVGAAVDAAGRLPGESGARLLALARESFASGMNVAALLGIAVTVFAAVVALVRLRYISYEQQQQAAAAVEEYELTVLEPVADR